MLSKLEVLNYKIQMLQSLQDIASVLPSVTEERAVLIVKIAELGNKFADELNNLTEEE